MKRLMLATLMTLFLTGATAPTATTQQPENVPSAQPETVECVPGAHDISVEEAVIPVTDGILQAKFITPDPGTGVFDPLPGLILTHGFLGNHTNLEADAANYARGCYAVLAHDYWGQGENLISTPPFSFYGDNERNDITRLVEVLQEHPMVDGLRLGILGHSQAAIQAWLALADADTRALFDVIIPWDGYPLSVPRLLAQNCASANLAQFVNPNNKRNSCASDPAACNLLEDATWDETVWNDLRADYVDSHPPNMDPLTGLPDTLGDRAIEDELLSSEIAFPHLLDIFSWFDTQQFGPESLNAYSLVTPPAGPNGYPAKAFLINRDGHSDPPWNDMGTLDDEHRLALIKEWLGIYLRGDTPTPPYVATGYLVDRFNAAGNPLFQLQTATTWPPTSTPLTLWLHPGGLAQTVAPGSGGGADTISQDFAGTDYDMADAVTDDPYFNRFLDLVNTAVITNVRYVSPVLAQDILLVGPPTVELHAEPTGELPLPTNYQVHLRLREQVSATVEPFVTHANACAWNATTPPAHFTGATFIGETRAHRFKEGSRIVLEFAAYDQEMYWHTRTALSVMPYLGDFAVKIWHNATQDSNARLDVVKSRPLDSIFVGDGGLSLGQGGGWLAMTTPTPEPEPLAMTAELFPDFTNPGGWRSWAPEVHLTCSGGEGLVACPETQFVFTDGISQTASYTATDELGTVVTATLTGVTVDRTPPEVTINVPELPAACASIPLLIDYTATDALSGVAFSAATFNGQAVNVGDTVLLVPGVNVLNIETQDVAGNVVSEEVTIECDG